MIGNSNDETNFPHELLLTNRLVLRLSTNIISNSNNETSFPHELLLTNRRVVNFRKAFANNSSADIKLSKTQLSKVIQLGGFLGGLFGPLLKTGLALIKNVIKLLAKSILIPLGVTVAASVAGAGIHKNILGSGKRPLNSALHTTTLIISNDEMEGIMMVVKYLGFWFINKRS